MVGVAVVGVGHWGPNLLRNFHESEHSCVRWVVDPDPSRLTLVKKRFPEIQLSESLEPVLSDATVEAVVIASPISTHYELAKSSLERGKHVLVEKPFTQNVVQGARLCDLADRASLVLMVGHVFLFNPGVRKIKGYLDQGLLGDLHYISMSRTNLGPIRLDANAAWDLGAHDISIANYWLGALPHGVSAVGGRWINKENEDAVFASFSYPANVLVNMHVSWLNPRKTRDITVVGSKKMLTFDDLNQSEPIRIYDKQVTGELSQAHYIDTHAEFRSSVFEGDVTIPKVKLGEPLRAECDHFIECIKEDRRPLVDGRVGLDVIRTLAAIEESMTMLGAHRPISEDQ